jgi:hypothetical protein
LRIVVPRLELFPFRYRDALTGKWVRARYLAELREIQQRYSQWELIGPPEIRQVPEDATPSQFNPFRSRA